MTEAELAEVEHIAGLPSAQRTASFRTGQAQSSHSPAQVIGALKWLWSWIFAWTRPPRLWLVWDSECPEEGSLLIRARSRTQAAATWIRCWWDEVDLTDAPEPVVFEATAAHLAARGESEEDAIDAVDFLAAEAVRARLDRGAA